MPLFSVNEADSFTLPERRLWQRSLELALEDIRTGSELKRRRAREWVESNEQHVGSFLFVCQVLGISPSWTRKKADAVTKHTHLCVCGEWQCITRILPIDGGGRIRCESVRDATCQTCFESMTQHLSGVELVVTLESMSERQEVDPLLSWRARTMLKAISNGDEKL